MCESVRATGSMTQNVWRAAREGGERAGISFPKEATTLSYRSFLHLINKSPSPLTHFQSVSFMKQMNVFNYWDGVIQPPGQEFV